MKRLALVAVIGLVVATGVAGCAAPRSQSSAPGSSATPIADAARAQNDATECGAYADARSSDLRYASYVGCFIGRGYPTFVSLTKYGSVTGVTVRAERGQNTERVVNDITTCAALEDTQVDVPPTTGLFMGLPSPLQARASYQVPFAKCLARLGYSTMDGDKPLAVAGVPAAPLTPPAPAAVAPVIPPPVAVAPVAPPTPAAPAVVAPVTPPPPVATVPPPVSSATPVTPPARPTPTVVAAIPPRTQKAPLGAVTLGLNVDPYSSPPVVIVVISKTPAGNAGVRPGDVVLTLDEIPIASHKDITKVLDTKRAGDVVKIDVQRGRQRLTLEATLTAR